MPTITARLNPGRLGSHAAATARALTLLLAAACLAGCAIDNDDEPIFAPDPDNAVQTEPGELPRGPQSDHAIQLEAPVGTRWVMQVRTRPGPENEVSQWQQQVLAPHHLRITGSAVAVTFCPAQGQDAQPTRPASLTVRTQADNGVATASHSAELDYLIQQDRALTALSSITRRWARDQPCELSPEETESARRRIPPPNAEPAAADDPTPAGPGTPEPTPHPPHRPASPRPPAQAAVR